MTKEEILKAHRCCAADTSCLWEQECPLWNVENCHTVLSIETLKLLEGENENDLCGLQRRED